MISKQYKWIKYCRVRVARWVARFKNGRDSIEDDSPSHTYKKTCLFNFMHEIKAMILLSNVAYFVLKHQHFKLRRYVSHWGPDKYLGQSISIENLYAVFHYVRFKIKYSKIILPLWLQKNKIILKHRCNHEFWKFVILHTSSI